jgi:hypothetical protein
MSEAKKLQLPTIRSYGNYSSDNYGVNSLSVSLGTITLYYSYKTIIAYEDIQDGLVVRENDWSTTTGKHLNWLDGGYKEQRKSSAEFEAMLETALERHIV